MKDPYARDLAEILEVHEETSNTKTFLLKFIDAEKQKNFSFIPGQFIVISIPGVGEAMFSISSSTSNRENFSTTIRKVGRMTCMIHKYDVGDKILVGGPYGSGWPITQLEGKDILIVTGGIGLPSPRPVIIYLDEHRKDFGFLEVLYGTRTPVESLFVREYEAWRNMERTRLALTVDYVPEGVKWEHGVGTVTTLFKEMMTKPRNSVALICGPEVMMHFVVSELINKGFHDDQLYLSLERRMRCGIAQCGHCQLGPKFVCKDGPVFKYSELKGLPDCGI
jgi:NAD(P)H-flavin reductase